MIIKLYHSSSNIIKDISLTKGRKNADFGQGFYLSDNLEFSYKWSNNNSIINVYELNMANLKIKRFEKDLDWLNYIKNNRKQIDLYKDYDLIIGPISSDTLYETYGILNYLNENEALNILKNDNTYYQYVLKTKQALNNIRLVSSFNIDINKLKKYKKSIIKEENKFINKINIILNK